MTGTRRALLRDAMRIAAGTIAGARSIGALAQASTEPPKGVARARTIRVRGPRADVDTIAEAAREAADGDVVEIAAGDYPGDVAVWTQRRLSIRAVGGPVWIDAAGRSAEGKAIWVIRDGDFDVAGIGFGHCRVPDRNGAGIRFENGALRIVDCRFVGNQNGLLTGNRADMALEVYGCAFTDSGTGTGYTHNLYVGAIGRFTVQASYFARCDAGHLLKCRARSARIVCNRLTDEPGGRASYEIDLPNGGHALVMGNLIVQEAATQNRAIVSFGAERYHRWPDNTLVLAHNTIVNRRTRDALFVQARAGATAVRMTNNLFVGDGRFEGAVGEDIGGNVRVAESAFPGASRYDFTPPPDSPLRGRAIDPAVSDEAIRPAVQYVHPRRLEPLPQDRPFSPGAFQE